MERERERERERKSDVGQWNKKIIKCKATVAKYIYTATVAIL